MDLSRYTKSTITNQSDQTVAIVVDFDTFLLPPEASLQTTAGGDVYLAFAGDAPMVAYPVASPEAVALAG